MDANDSATAPSDPERWPLPPDEDGLCYRNEQHFDETMARVGRDHLSGRASSFERAAPVGLTVLAIASLFVCTGLSPVAALPLLALTIPLIVVLVSADARHARRVEREHLCFRCTYPLLHAPVDSKGWSRCPECGMESHRAYYQRPPPMYQRTET